MQRLHGHRIRVHGQCGRRAGKEHSHLYQRETYLLLLLHSSSSSLLLLSSANFPLGSNLRIIPFPAGTQVSGCDFSFIFIILIQVSFSSALRLCISAGNARGHLCGGGKQQCDPCHELDSFTGIRGCVHDQIPDLHLPCCKWLHSVNARCEHRHCAELQRSYCQCAATSRLLSPSISFHHLSLYSSRHIQICT